MKLDAERLRKLRESRGWSQEQLASAAGLSARTVQRAESDGTASRESKVCLAAALGVPHADLEFSVTSVAPTTVAWSRHAIAQHIHTVLASTFLMLGLGFLGIQIFAGLLPVFAYLGGFFAVVGIIEVVFALIAKRSERLGARSVA